LVSPAFSATTQSREPAVEEEQQGGLLGQIEVHSIDWIPDTEEGLLDRSGCLHVGIRGSLHTGADLSQDSELGFQQIPVPDVEQPGVPGMVGRIRERVGGRPVYVSVDIDVLDPAHAPGTGALVT
jgi:agmatinase